MRKILSRLCAMILVFAMVTTSSGVVTFAESLSSDANSSEDKIVEQLKADLGEKKANEILQESVDNTNEVIDTDGKTENLEIANEQSDFDLENNDESETDLTESKTKEENLTGSIEPEDDEEIENEEPTTEVENEDEAAIENKTENEDEEKQGESKTENHNETNTNGNYENENNDVNANDNSLLNDDIDDELQKDIQDDNAVNDENINIQTEKDDAIDKDNQDNETQKDTESSIENTNNTEDANDTEDFDNIVDEKIDGQEENTETNENTLNDENKAENDNIDNNLANANDNNADNNSINQSDDNAENEIANVEKLETKDLKNNELNIDVSKNEKVVTATNSEIGESSEENIIKSLDENVATTSVADNTNEEKILKGAATHTLNDNWLDNAGILKEEITAIFVQKGGTAPTGTEFVIDAGTGLKGYKNGTEITIYASGNDDVIRLNTKFQNFALESIDANAFDTSQVTDMSYMFYSCSITNDLDLSGWDTSQVTDMSYMFYSCSTDNDLDLSGWDTSQVTNMSYMFYYFCDQSLNISGWDTSQVTNMSCMFLGCRITSLDLSGFDTNKVTNMYRMFDSCMCLNSINVSGWDTSQVVNMSDMFYDCELLTNIDLSDWANSQVTDMSFMFTCCWRLTNINLSGFGTSQVTNMCNMFDGCNNLTTVNLSGWDTSQVTDMSGMFYNCSSLTTLDVSGWNTSQVTNMHTMFYGCNNLTTVDLSGWDTSQVTNMHTMFYWCNNLTTVNLSGWNTSQVTNMSGMFYNCSSLTTLDLSGWDTSQVTNMSEMFNDCNNLTTVDLSGWDTSQVTNMHRMFYGCNNLTTVNLSGWDTSQVTDMSGMFYACELLTNIDLSDLNTSQVTNMAYMFGDCSSLTSLDVSGFDTSQVTGMSGMFSDCSSLESLDLSSWDISKVTDIGYYYISFYSVPGMFENCSSLTTLDLSGWDTSQVTNMDSMFFSCSSLVTIYASNSFDTSSLDNDSNMFYGCTSLVGEKGTTYDSSHIDKEYARIDAVGTPGYFTYRAAPITYTVTFNTNGGSNISNRRVNAGGKITKPTNPIKAGYNFVNWYKEAALTNVWNFDSDIVNSNITLYAKWEQVQNQYTVTFNTNGGTSIAPVVVNDGSKITKPTNPTRSGYNFANWYKEPEFTNVWNFDIDTVNSNITIYAKWEQVQSQYTVTFNTDGGTSIAPAVVNEGNKITKPTNPTRSGYNFVNWYKESSLTNVWNFDSDVVNGNITLYAKWEETSAKQWTVTFNTSGGSSIEKVIVNDGNVVARPANPTRAGFKFVNWYKESRCANVFDFATVITKNTTLYAKWEKSTAPIYTVTFVTNGGSEVAPIKVNENEKIATSVATARANYTFAGWYENEGLTSLFDINTRVITSDITLYAKWNKNQSGIVQYTVTFDSNGGKAVPFKVVNSGEKITKPTNPTKSGYTFNGWYKEAGLKNQFDFNTAITSDITLYAKWTKQKSSPSGGGGGGGSDTYVGGPKIDAGLNSIQMGLSSQVNIVPTQDTAKLVPVKVADIPVLEANTEWIFNNIDNTWSLALDKNNKDAKALNGFFVLISNDALGQPQAKTYYFDEAGKMTTGWVKDAQGSMYFFEVDKQANEGAMVVGWKDIGGFWYYFGTDGKMFANTVTPDGSLVGADGKWIDPNTLNTQIALAPVV